MGYKHNIEDIISKGANLIRKNGYHNVGINQILKTCEIPKGSFYNFFESKEDFAVKVLDYYGDTQGEWVRCFMTDESKRPIDRLASFYTALIEGNQEDGFNAGCLVNNMSIELGGINSLLSEAADRNFRKWIKLIANAVKEAQAAKEVTNFMQPEDLAEYLHAGFYGALARMKVNNDREYLDKWYLLTFKFIQN